MSHFQDAETDPSPSITLVEKLKLQFTIILIPNRRSTLNEKLRLRVVETHPGAAAHCHRPLAPVLLFLVPLPPLPLPPPPPPHPELQYAFHRLQEQSLLRIKE